MGTDVGVTQALALRLNSSLFCDTVAQQAFPTSCLGNASFNASYTNADDSAIKLAKYQSLPFSVRICAPRNTTSPWEVTGNRQDIMEEFYLDFQYPSLNQSASTEMDPRTGFTHHCRATTTMGYFSCQTIGTTTQRVHCLSRIPTTTQTATLSPPILSLVQARS